MTIMPNCTYIYTIIPQLASFSVCMYVCVSGTWSSFSLVCTLSEYGNDPSEPACYTLVGGLKYVLNYVIDSNEFNTAAHIYISS